MSSEIYWVNDYLSYMEVFVAFQALYINWELEEIPSSSKLKVTLSLADCLSYIVVRNHQECHWTRWGSFSSEREGGGGAAAGVLMLLTCRTRKTDTPAPSWSIHS